MGLQPARRTPSHPLTLSPIHPMSPLLLTSFATWEAHQRSNTSDDLIGLLQASGQLPATTQLMRHLPVDFQLAPLQVIAAMVRLRPAVVVCCGMAEGRSLLTLEKFGRRSGQVQATDLNLVQLCEGTAYTALSQDAGSYVCNHLYYEILAFIQKHSLSVHCLFVHVPLITDHNRERLIRDFALMVSRLSAIAITADANDWNAVSHDVGAL